MTVYLIPVEMCMNSCQKTALQAMKTYSNSMATQGMTTFNLHMELCQSPFYPRQREGFASSNRVQRLQHVRWGVMGSRWQLTVWSEEGCLHINVGTCVLFKGFFLHHSSAAIIAFFLQQHWLLIDSPTVAVECTTASQIQRYGEGGNVRTDRYL